MDTSFCFKLNYHFKAKSTYIYFLIYLMTDSIEKFRNFPIPSEPNWKGILQAASEAESMFYYYKNKQILLLLITLLSL